MVINQVVPTDYERKYKTKATFQYAATEHYRHVNTMSNNGLPGVYFFYEVSGLPDLWLLACVLSSLSVATNVLPVPW